MPTGIARPKYRDLLGEVAAPFDWMSVGFGARRLLAAPDGDGRTIMLLPGYGAGPRTMYPLASFLRSKNYKVTQWGLGTNIGEIYDYVELIGERLESEFNEPVTLIGWSLGGLIAREVARLYEPRVREIITMGTPVVGGPKYVFMAERIAKAQGLDLEEIEEEVHQINSQGLKQPITAFYSKRDGIVGWRASIDTYNRHARNIEVDTTHLGIAINSKVWLEIAETLAAS